MNHSACPDCQLRFTASQAVGFRTCPICGGDLRVLAAARSAMGYQLFEPGIAEQLMPEAISAAMPVPPRL